MWIECVPVTHTYVHMHILYTYICHTHVHKYVCMYIYMQQLFDYRQKFCIFAFGTVLKKKVQYISTMHRNVFSILECIRAFRRHHQRQPLFCLWIYYYYFFNQFFANIKAIFIYSLYIHAYVLIYAALDINSNHMRTLNKLETKVWIINRSKPNDVHRIVKGTDA